MAASPPTRRGFSLVELLVVVAVVALVAAVLLPTLASARASARSVGCMSNLRQMGLATIAYANERNGRTPALGVPWGRQPFWAIELLARTSDLAAEGGALYDDRSMLVCPEEQFRSPVDMTRTYAINVTGYAGAPGDKGDYDSEIVSFRLDRVRRPSETPVYVDSAVTFIPDDAPPPTRTASTVDFRDSAHVPARLAFRHAGACHCCNADGSVTPHREVQAQWRTPLP